MADLRKFLDQAGVGTLWAKIKAADEATLSSAKSYADDIKNTIVGDYATKAELEAESTARSSADTTLQANIDKKVATAVYEEKMTALDISIGSHQSKLTAHESQLADHEARIDTMETFFDSAAASDDVIDTLKEIQEYIASDQTGASNMLASINQNAANITAINNNLATNYQTSAQARAEYAAKATVEAMSTDLEELNSKKEDKANLGALAYKDTVATTDIDDGAVTKAKLATALQTSLGKADTAVQSVATGTKNGTISVDGTNIAVKGLQSGAYFPSENYVTNISATYNESTGYWTLTARQGSGTIALNQELTIPVMTTAEIEAICG